MILVDNITRYYTNTHTCGPIRLCFAIENIKKTQVLKNQELKMSNCACFFYHAINVIPIYANEFMFVLQVLSLQC